MHNYNYFLLIPSLIFFQPIHNGATPRHASQTIAHVVSTILLARARSRDVLMRNSSNIACIVTRVHSEPHLPFCTTCSHTHSKQAFGTHLKIHLSMDSVAIYKGAFYTRSKFTLKVVAEYMDVHSYYYGRILSEIKGHI